MGARKDLMEVAGALATEARAFVPRDDDATADEAMQNARFAAELASGAKAALEAAALVDADPAPIVAALARFEDRLDGWTLPHAVAQDQGVPAALDQLAEEIEVARKDINVAVAVQEGYLSLRALLMGLLRDFSAGEGETARRIAARIEAGLDAADEAITAAKGQEAQHG